MHLDEADHNNQHANVIVIFILNLGLVILSMIFYMIIFKIATTGQLLEFEKRVKPI